MHRGNGIVNRDSCCLASSKRGMNCRQDTPVKKMMTPSAVQECDRRTMAWCLQGCVSILVVACLDDSGAPRLQVPPCAGCLCVRAAPCLPPYLGRVSIRQDGRLHDGALHDAGVVLSVLWQLVHHAHHGVAGHVCSRGGGGGAGQAGVCPQVQGSRLRCVRCVLQPVVGLLELRCGPCVLSCPGTTCSQDGGVKLCRAATPTTAYHTSNCLSLQKMPFTPNTACHTNNSWVGGQARLVLTSPAQLVKRTWTCRSLSAVAGTAQAAGMTRWHNGSQVQGLVLADQASSRNAMLSDAHRPPVNTTIHHTRVAPTGPTTVDMADDAVHNTPGTFAATAQQCDHSNAQYSPPKTAHRATLHHTHTRVKRGSRAPPICSRASRRGA